MSQNTNKQNQNSRNSIPKHQKQVNQVQSTNETSPNSPRIDNTETSELQLNHINCEVTDVESETENTLIINMLKIEQEPKIPVYPNS